LATLFPPELINALGGSPPPAHDRHPPPDLEQAVTIEKGHGRIETRRLWVSRESAAHLNWPGAAQLCRIERVRESAGKVSREIAYAITSLASERARPEELLALWRDHWRIENTLHWRRDVILREDASRIRSGVIPQAMAALRNAMLRLVHNTTGPLAAIRETFAENRGAAILTVKNGIL
jgi:predicted transposase YbfD/YdcC